jgi:hypothetical protein
MIVIAVFALNVAQPGSLFTGKGRSNLSEVEAGNMGSEEK